MSIANDWLSNLWIISNNSGVCIFEGNYKEITMNADLISGFLVAMINFGKELADKDLKKIQFNDLKIAFKHNKLFIIAVAITENAREPDVQAFLNLIEVEFQSRYGQYLENFSGDVAVFSDFNLYVESLLNRKALAVVYVKDQIVKSALEGKEAQFVKTKLEGLEAFLEARKKEFIEKKTHAKNEMEKKKQEAFKFFSDKFDSIKNKIQARDQSKPQDSGN